MIAEMRWNIGWIFVRIGKITECAHKYPLIDELHVVNIVPEACSSGNLLGSCKSILLFSW